MKKNFSSILSMGLKPIVGEYWLKPMAGLRWSNYDFGAISSQQNNNSQTSD